MLPTICYFVDGILKKKIVGLDPLGGELINIRNLVLTLAKWKAIELGNNEKIEYLNTRRSDLSDES